MGACSDDGEASDGEATDETTSPGSDTTTGGSSVTGGAGDATTVACEAGSGSGDVSEVTISGFTFRPGEIEIDAGTAVSFTNEDGADHSVWSDDRVDGDPAWLSVGSDPAFRLPEVLHEGDASTCTFQTAGTYEYLCGVHNSMTGTVVVR